MIPNIPSVPTDNLYKFKAVSGLILTLAAIGALISFDWMGTAAVERAQMARHRFFAAFDADTAAFREALRSGASHANPQEILRLTARAESLAADFKQATKALGEERVTEDQDSERLVFYEHMSMIVIVGSAIFTYLAFGEWRTRHQEFQDRLLKAQVERAELEAEEVRRRVGAIPAEPARVPTTQA